MKDCQEAMKTIEEYENIIKTNKKNIIRFAYEKGDLKRITKFKNLIEQFKIKTSTIIFKRNINFLKSYYKDLEKPELFS